MAVLGITMFRQLKLNIFNWGTFGVARGVSFK